MIFHSLNSFSPRPPGEILNEYLCSKIILKSVVFQNMKVNIDFTGVFSAFLGAGTLLKNLSSKLLKALAFSVALRHHVVKSWCDSILSCSHQTKRHWVGLKAVEAF